MTPDTEPFDPNDPYSCQRCVRALAEQFRHQQGGVSCNPGGISCPSVYHAFVRRRLRRAYELINSGQLDTFASQFAPNAVFAFPGEHALAGEFRGPDGVRAWFAEVRRLFPDFRLELRRIVVEGGPLHTHVATWFVVSGTFPDGTPYRNTGAQLLELRRGRVWEDRIFEDTQVVVDALDRLRALGMDPGAAVARLRDSTAI